MYHAVEVGRDLSTKLAVKQARLWGLACHLPAV